MTYNMYSYIHPYNACIYICQRDRDNNNTNRESPLKIKLEKLAMVPTPSPPHTFLPIGSHFLPIILTMVISSGTNYQEEIFQ